MDAESFLYPGTGEPIDVSGCSVVAVQAVVTVTTPANKTFTDTDVNTTNETVTITAHGFTTGQLVTLTSTGTLPAGLSTLTNYYLIVVNANTIKFASSLVNALAGTAINLTSQGTVAATNTVVVTALSGGLLVRGSLDQEVWFDLCAEQALGSETEFLFALTDPTTRYVAIGSEVDSGQISVVVSVLGKGIV